MQDEFNLLKENNIWKLVPRPADRDIIDSRWVFHLKYNIDGIIEKRKGRFVARGFTQVPRVDYNEIYPPVVSYTTIRLLIALATKYNLTIHQMDVKSAYLNGKIDTDIYIEQPQLFEERNKA